MCAEYIPFIIAASNAAKDAIIQYISNKGIKKGEQSKRKEELSKHYRRHSEQLVTALLQWGNEMNFSTSEYINGDLSFSEQVNPPKIPYLEDVMKHVKVSYPDLLESYTSIEDRHKELCKQINKAMKQGSVVPYVPSYEEIILSAIKKCCPQLKSTIDMELRENNIFLIRMIYFTIFEKVSYEKSQIKLFVDSTSNNGIHRLIDRSSIFAQGTSGDMSNLKRTLEKLVLDNEVKKRISEYHEFRTKLTNYEDSGKLMEEIQRIYDEIHGGRLLGGFLACDLCKPDSTPV